MARSNHIAVCVSVCIVNFIVFFFLPVSFFSLISAFTQQRSMRMNVHVSFHMAIEIEIDENKSGAECQLHLLTIES